MRCVWHKENLHAIGLQGEPQHMHLQYAISFTEGQMCVQQNLSCQLNLDKYISTMFAHGMTGKSQV